MKQEQFEKVIEKQLESIREVLLIKSKEYATEDKLHNFRISAQLQNITMEQALAGMLSKHTVSIYDMIASGDRYSIEKWDEKINDHIVYLLLLRAIIEEKITHEYIIETDNGPIAVTNPTYSRFDEELKYRQFLKANPALDPKNKPEFLDKRFNTDPSPNNSRLMDEVHEESEKQKTQIKQKLSVCGEYLACDEKRYIYDQFPKEMMFDPSFDSKDILEFLNNKKIGYPDQKIITWGNGTNMKIVNDNPKYSVFYYYNGRDPITKFICWYKNAIDDIPDEVDYEVIPTDTVWNKRNES